MRLIPIVTLIAAGALTLAACGGDNGGTTATTVATATTAATTAATTPATGSTVAPGTSSSSRPATTVQPSTTIAAAASSTTNPNSVESVTDKATAALLTPSEVGAGFVSGDYSAADPNQPSVCGQPGMEAKVPSSVHVGTVIGNATTNQVLQQEVRVYLDEEEASRAYDAATAAIACTDATVTLDDGTTQAVTISAPQDVADAVGGDRANGWQLLSADTQAVAVLVQVQAAIVSYQFQAPAGADAAEPDPLAVAKLGVAKVRAA